nr:hypothetical protein CFP56_07390 [Quercus suber]
MSRHQDLHALTMLVMDEPEVVVDIVGSIHARVDFWHAAGTARWHSKLLFNLRNQEAVPWLALDRPSSIHVIVIYGFSAYTARGQSANQLIALLHKANLTFVWNYDDARVMTWLRIMTSIASAKCKARRIACVVSVGLAWTLVATERRGKARHSACATVFVAAHLRSTTSRISPCVS